MAKKWTDLDLEEEANEKLFNMSFIGRSLQDTRKKLQKVDGAGGMSVSQLIEIAYKVHNNREVKKEKKGQQKKKLQGSLLAAAIVDR